ncbi:MAG: S1C family serine protease [Candidatus Levyibacteriota bacterium]
MRRLIILIIILIAILFAIGVGQKYLPTMLHLNTSNMSLSPSDGKVKVVTEESITIDTVKKAAPSVVTVIGNAAQPQNGSTSKPFFFNFPGFQGQQQPGQTPDQPQAQSIGSGFIIGTDGLIVTNKHVVSDTNEKYQVITNNDKKYEVQKIYRDPLNDIALLQIDQKQNAGTTLTPLTLGNSTNLQAGQYVIAIGTALGEFRNSVTTGVISGLGRGITAGSAYEGSVERLDNVIQTDAAINPGNSGGPLFNSSGQVIGINTAVSQSGQNIGFAIPINVIKDSLNNFNQTGKFTRPYLGVEYKMITQDLASLNDLPVGAYVQNVVQDSSADRAGIQSGDVITEMDGKKITQENQLSEIIAKKKVRDSLSITLIRNGDTQNVTATLLEAPQQ